MIKGAAHIGWMMADGGQTVISRSLLRVLFILIHINGKVVDIKGMISNIMPGNRGK